MTIEKSEYSAAILCIIISEFCERFSFCGLRTILSIYLRNELLFSENAATCVYHFFIMGCYIVPLIGALWADGIFGRYRTIFYFSLIYLFGNVAMCLGTVPTLELSPIAFSALGLVLIALGSGGIKPCVAAFGADQFSLPEQHELLNNFFSTFYFTINLGGFVGMIITPIVRKYVTCFGDETCYVLGFGFPAFLMLFSLLFFIMGKPWYKIKIPKQNIIVKFIKIFWRKNVRKDSLSQIDTKLVNDVKIVSAVLFLYIPVPIFWSLFDQQGSRWTFQASHMKGKILGIEIIPDQMQVVNPAMVLIFIPIFDKILYPYFLRTKFLVNPLHRMAIGGMIASLAFISAGLLEIVLETTYSRRPDESIDIFNLLPCNIRINDHQHFLAEIQNGEMAKFWNYSNGNYTKYHFLIDIPIDCNIFFDGNTYELETISYNYQMDIVLIGANDDDQIRVWNTNVEDFQKSLSRKPRLKIIFIRNSILITKVMFTLRGGDGVRNIYCVDDMRNLSLIDSDYMEFSEGIYELSVNCEDLFEYNDGVFHLQNGGVYFLVVYERNDQIESIDLHTMSPPHTINILWMLPQYFLISIAEIMFGVAGLEFSFTQAPKSMKTITIAGWYLSVAIGNFLVIIITQSQLFGSQAYEFFLFAALMIADMMVFVVLSSNYQFVEIEADSTTRFIRD